MQKVYRILIVEDDKTMLEVLTAVIERLPIPKHVQTATDGQKALAELRNQPFDIMILDLLLPGIRGQDLLQTLDADPTFKGFPVLVNSTVSDLKGTPEQLLGFKNLKVELTPQMAGPEEIGKSLRSLLGIH